MVFLIIPLLLLVTVIQLRESWGSYYFTHNADPAYLYLINSLNIATFHPVQQVDNPGTTIQLLGGATVKVISLFRGVKDIEADVFTRPDYYLTTINRVLFSINLIAIAFLGFFAYRMTGNIWVSLLLQGAPFASYLTIKSMLMVSPETMSVFTGVLFIMLIVWAATKRSNELTPGLFALFSALVIAFGLATKITFVPFILLPLVLLRENRWRAYYLILSVVIFHIFLIPAYAHYDFFLHWIKILFLHTENYGQGTTEIIDVSAAFINLIKLLVLEHTFFIVLSFSISLLVFIFLNKDLRSDLRDDNHVRILFAMVVTIVLHTLFVTKHYNPRYMIPSLTLLTTIIYISVLVFRRIKVLYSFNFLQSLSFRIGAAVVLGLLFLTRHFMGYMPGDTVVVWRQTINSRNLLTDWIHQPDMENSLFILFLGVLVFTAGLFIYHGKDKLKGNPIFSYCLLTIVALYHLRHIDIGGFNYRIAEEKKEALAIVDTVENKYRDYTKIFGGRSSSKLYALKYGTSTNFTRASQLSRLNELYPDKNIYFWRLKWGDPTFDNWIEKITLTDILRQNRNVIIQGDMSSLNPQSVQEMEQLNNVKLTPVYEGKTEIVYSIKRVYPSGYGRKSTP